MRGEGNVGDDVDVVLNESAAQQFICSVYDTHHVRPSTPRSVAATS